MEMGDLWPMRAEQIAQLAERRPAPQSAGGKLQATHRIDRVIGQTILHDLVPVRPEHRDLGRHALIFTAHLLIEVVRYDNVHDQSFPASVAIEWCGRSGLQSL